MAQANSPSIRRNERLREVCQRLLPACVRSQGASSKISENCMSTKLIMFIIYLIVLLSATYVVRDRRHSGAALLKLDPLLSLDALFAIRMLDELHLRHQIGQLDDLGPGAAAGQDHVQLRAFVPQFA